jgi:hypothetical protein
VQLLSSRLFAADLALLERYHILIGLPVRRQLEVSRRPTRHVTTGLWPFVRRRQWRHKRLCRVSFAQFESDQRPDEAKADRVGR